MRLVCAGGAAQITGRSSSNSGAVAVAAAVTAKDDATGGEGGGPGELDPATGGRDLSGKSGLQVRGPDKVAWRLSGGYGGGLLQA